MNAALDLLRHFSAEARELADSLFAAGAVESAESVGVDIIEAEAAIEILEQHYQK